MSDIAEKFYKEMAILRKEYLEYYRRIIDEYDDDEDDNNGLPTDKELPREQT